MYLSRPARILLRAGTALTLCFLYAPLVVIAIYAFNPRRTLGWPTGGATTEWFDKAFHNPGLRDALFMSLKAGLGATLIALPGIVTGMALNATFGEVLAPLGIGFGLFTIVVGPATFCIVTTYNNVIARLRRTSPSFEEASADLGADTWTTFRLVTLPALRSAMVAGALLAFALSFDEVIVTTFTAGDQATLPIWILTNLSRPNQLPIVNVVAVLVVP